MDDSAMPPLEAAGGLDAPFSPARRPQQRADGGSGSGSGRKRSRRQAENDASERQGNTHLNAAAVGFTAAAVSTPAAPASSHESSLAPTTSVTADISSSSSSSSSRSKRHRSSRSRTGRSGTSTRSADPAAAQARFLASLQRLSADEDDEAQRVEPAEPAEPPDEKMDDGASDAPPPLLPPPDGNLGISEREDVTMPLVAEPTPVAAANPAAQLHPTISRSRTVSERLPPSNGLRRSTSASSTMAQPSSSPLKAAAASPSASAAASAPASPGLCAGLRILFVPSPELTSKRIQLLTAQILKRGGKVLTLELGRRSSPASGSGGIPGIPSSGSGSGSGRGAAGSKAAPKPLRPTHVLCGSQSDFDGRVAETAAALEPRYRSAAAFVSAEWLSLSLQAQVLQPLENYRVQFQGSGVGADGRPGMSRAESIAAGASALIPTLQPGDMSPSPGPAAPLSKRDIRYVMERMDQERQAASSASAATANGASDSSTIAYLPSQPGSFEAPSQAASAVPAVKSEHVKLEDTKNGFLVPPSTLSRSSLLQPGLPLSPLMEGSGSQEESSAVKQEGGEHRHGQLRGTPRRLKLDEAKVSAASSSAAPVVTGAATAPTDASLSLLVASYSQPVPSFSDTVPYDSSRYLPLATHVVESSSESSSAGKSTVAAPVMKVQAPIAFAAAQHGTQAAMALAVSAPKPPTTDLSSQHFAGDIAQISRFPSSSSATAAPAGVLSLHPSPSAIGAGAWVDRNKAQLACQIFSSNHRNLNPHLTQPLEELESINSALGDTWRTYAYRKAVGILKRLPMAIDSEEKLDELKNQAIRGLGGKMLAKISEIIRTGNLKKVGDMKSNDMVATLQLFSGIHGVGAATARQWYTWGLRSVDQLLTDPRVQLSSTQKVGLQFMADKSKRIPRLEVTAILEWVQRVAAKILPGVTVICCGSYRRGAPSSGDVDLLFTHASFTTREISASGVEDAASVRQREVFLRELLAQLHTPVLPGSAKWEEDKAWAQGKYAQLKEDSVRIKKELAAAASGASSSSGAAGAATSASPLSPPSADTSKAGPRPPGMFLTGDLSSFEKLSSRHGSAYWMGFCSLPEHHPFFSGWSRRIDLKVYPAAHFPFALLYFTGSDHFNRSMRFFAKSKKWTLSDHGLCPALRVNGDKVWSGRSVYCQTERDIFDALGLVYVPPEQRNVYQHFDLTEEDLRMRRQQSLLTAGNGAIATSASSAAAAAAASSSIKAEGDEREVNEPVHPALRVTAAASAAAAAAESSSSSSQVFLPSGVPLKREVVQELSELEQFTRAQEQLRRIAQEEESILQGQLQALDTRALGKQAVPGPKSL